MPAIGPGYAKHQVDISFYAGPDGFFNLFIGDFPFFFWIIQLSPGCKGTFGKPHSFQFITAQGSSHFHNRITDQISYHLPFQKQ